MEWQGLPSDDATWEPRESFVERYPDFQLEDELFPEERRDVTGQEQPAQAQPAQQPAAPVWITYQRRGAAQVARRAMIYFLRVLFVFLKCGTICKLNTLL